MSAVGASDEGAQAQARTVGRLGAIGEGGERGLAVPFERHHDPALGGDAERGLDVDERSQESGDALVVRARLDPERPLSDRGERHLGGEHVGRSPFEPEPHQAGARQDDGVALPGVDLAQPRVDVSAHGDDGEIRPLRPERDRPAKAAGADRRAAGERGELAVARSDEHVARILAARNADQREAVGQLAGHVLDGVHRDVRLAREQLLLDLLDEEPLAADLGERTILDAVAAGDDLQLDRLDRRGRGVRRQQAGDEGAALREGEGALARGVDHA